MKYGVFVVAAILSATALSSYAQSTKYVSQSQENRATYRVLLPDGRVAEFDDATPLEQAKKWLLRDFPDQFPEGSTSTARLMAENFGPYALPDGKIVHFHRSLTPKNKSYIFVREWSTDANMKKGAEPRPKPHLERVHYYILSLKDGRVLALPQRIPKNDALRMAAEDSSRWAEITQQLAARKRAETPQVNTTPTKPPEDDSWLAKLGFRPRTQQECFEKYARSTVNPDAQKIIAASCGWIFAVMPPNLNDEKPWQAIQNAARCLYKRGDEMRSRDEAQKTIYKCADGSDRAYSAFNEILFYRERELADRIDQMRSDQELAQRMQNIDRQTEREMREIDRKYDQRMREIDQYDQQMRATQLYQPPLPVGPSSYTITIDGKMKYCSGVGTSVTCF